MSVPEIYLVTFVGMIVWLTLIWIVSVILTNASIIDIFWGLGFVIAGCAYFALTDGYELRKLYVLLLVTLWGFRLSGYLAIRNLGRGEDYRYQQFRKRYGESSYWWKSFFQVFMLQGVLLMIVSAPLLAAQVHETPANFTILDVIGGIFWIIGFLFEAVGDWQLYRFKANPENKGKVLQSGVWRYTRHPNYFGNAMIWWGFFLIALSTPGGFITIFSPILMNFLLLRVSGVAMLEKSLKKSKPEYADYVERTSAFIPWLPKPAKK